MKNYNNTSNPYTDDNSTQSNDGYEQYGYEQDHNQDESNQDNWEREGRNRSTAVRDASGLVSTAPPEENAIVVGFDLAIAPQLLGLDDSLTELELLAKTAGVHVVGRVT